ncbi:MAG: hypothetical protein QXR58_02665 [Candidatus Micrarchaeaceae archaeon]
MEKYANVEYFIIAVSGLAIIVGAVLLNLFIATSGAVALLMLVILHYFKEYIDAFIFRHSGAMQLIGEYELRGEREAAVLKVGKRYVATACVIIEAGQEQDGIGKEKIENAIARISYPFKLTLAVERFNTERILDRLQTKRSMKEKELSRVESAGHGRGLAKSMSIRRELESIDHDLKSIIGGAVPMKIRYYAMVSTADERRFAAEEGAVARAKSLASVLGGMFGAGASVARGNELVQLLKFDSILMEEHDEAI